MPRVLASSFADLADLAAYKRAKARGLSDREAFKFGDNGIGLWGDFTATEHSPMCALPPEDWIDRWVTRTKARGAKVAVTYKAKTIIGELRDTMPHKHNIKNGAGIDLNPGFAKAFGLRPPFLVWLNWEWV